ncbi:MAG: YciI family protein [Candidatus Heimdallarchaeota archaeon]
MDNHNAYFVTIRGLRESFPKDITQEEQNIMEDHFRYLQELFVKGKLAVAGRNLDDGTGYIILKTRSLNEAQMIMSQDPSVQQKVVFPSFKRFLLAVGNRD